MSIEMIKVLHILSFVWVGFGSFLVGYLSRYLFTDDYDAGYAQGYDDGRRFQKELNQLGKTE